MLTPQKFFSAVQQQVEQVLPGVAKSAQDDIQNHIKMVVTSVLNRLDLVTRDEFDVQVAVLEKTRAKVDQLEKVVASLEQKLKS